MSDQDPQTNIKFSIIDQQGPLDVFLDNKYIRSYNRRCFHLWEPWFSFFTFFI